MTCVFIASSVWGSGVSDFYVVHKGGGTHTEDMKDPVEVQPPDGNLFLAVPGVEVSGNHISSALLTDFSFDLRHGPRIGSKISRSPTKLLKVLVTDVTHVVSCLIASRTELLTSSSLFPLNPRSRAVQTSAQASPSST